MSLNGSKNTSKVTSSVIADVKKVQSIKKNVEISKAHILKCIENINRLQTTIETKCTSSVIKSLYNQYIAKTKEITSIAMVETTVETSPVIAQPSALNKKLLSDCATNIISDTGFIEFLNKSHLHSSQMKETKILIATIRLYCSELTHIKREYSLIMHNVKTLTAILERAA